MAMAPLWGAQKHTESLKTGNLSISMLETGAAGEIRTHAMCLLSIVFIDIFYVAGQCCVPPVCLLSLLI